MRKKAPPDRDGVRVAELNEGLYKRLLWPVRPLTAFWQMGDGKTHRLAKYGIYTMGERMTDVMLSKPCIRHPQAKSSRMMCTGKPSWSDLSINALNICS